MSGKKRIHGLGASNHTLYERAKNDYYSTDPLAIQLLDKYNLLDHDVPYWETACGNGKLVDELNNLGYNCSRATDLIYRGCGEGGVDFFKVNETFNGNTITNPPYKNINDWILLWVVGLLVLLVGILIVILLVLNWMMNILILRKRELIIVKVS